MDAASIENENASPSSRFLFVFKSALSIFIYERKRKLFALPRGFLLVICPVQGFLLKRKVRRRKSSVLKDVSVHGKAT